VSRVYQDGPWDALRAQEPRIMERLEDLEDALLAGDQVVIPRLRTELADEIISALQVAYDTGEDDGWEAESSEAQDPE
jgi:hypothetical protein